MKQQWDLFIGFFRAGMLGYGGGPSSIPLIHKEVVDNYKWMSEDEFGDTFALANTLPGPIATKLAGYIGYRIGGVLGLLNAVLATVLPTIILMIVLLATLTSFKDRAWVAGMTQAVMPVIGVMLAVLTYDYFKQANKGMGLKASVILLIVSFVVMQILHIHPGFFIAVLLAAAIFKPDKKKKPAPSGETGPSDIELLDKKPANQPEKDSCDKDISNHEEGVSG